MNSFSSAVTVGRPSDGFCGALRLAGFLAAALLVAAGFLALARAGFLAGFLAGIGGSLQAGESQRRPAPGYLVPRPAGAQFPVVGGPLHGLQSPWAWARLGADSGGILRVW